MKALILHEGKFLIVQQHIPSGMTYWDLPGGRMDVGETPEETLRREVREETTLELDIDRPFGCFWFFRDDGDQVVCTTFICKPMHTDVDLTKNIANEHIHEFRWVTKEEFLSGDYPVAHESLKQMLQAL